MEVAYFVESVGLSSCVKLGCHIGLYLVGIASDLAYSTNYSYNVTVYFFTVYSVCSAHAHLHMHKLPRVIIWKKCCYAWLSENLNGVADNLA